MEGSGASAYCRRRDGVGSMSETARIEELVVELSRNPFDAALNLAVAVEYDRLNQHASAISFYLRAAEFGTLSRDPNVYAALLRIAGCLETQKDRDHTVTNVLMQAVAYWPERPEAWYRLSHWHERAEHWQEAYSYAAVPQVDFPPLPVDVDYPGLWVLKYQRAVAAWWIGQADESRWLFQELHGLRLPEPWGTSVRDNLQRLGQ